MNVKHLKIVTIKKYNFFFFFYKFMNQLSKKI